MLRNKGKVDMRVSILAARLEGGASSVMMAVMTGDCRRLKCCRWNVSESSTSGLERSTGCVRVGVEADLFTTFIGVEDVMVAMEAVEMREDKRPEGDWRAGLVLAYSEIDELSAHYGQ